MSLRWKSAMRKLAAGLLFTAPALAADEPAPAAAAPVEQIAAEDPKEEQEEEPSTRFLQSALIGDCLAERTGLYLYGWAEITANWNDHGSVINYPAAPFIYEQGINVQQLYFVQGRSVDTDKNFDAGYRVDMLYGLDARVTGALGLDARQGPLPNGTPYGTGSYVTNTVAGNDRVLRIDPTTGIPLNNDVNQFALPQLYGEFHIGVHQGISVKVGHFYSPVGYQVVTAPDNFFVTMPYTFQYGEPFTHTGVFASGAINDNISIGAGWIRGWDNFDDQNSQGSFLGTLNVQLTEKLSYGLVIVAGPEQFPGQERRERWLDTNVFQWQVTEKFKTVLQHDLGIEEGSALDGIPRGVWYGLNGYAFYDLCDTVAVGVRGEWFRDQAGTRVVPISGVLTPGNWYEWAIGANWTPHAGILVRPELRFDYFSASNGGSDDVFGAAVIPGAGPVGTSSRQMTAIIDIIFSF